ncbi:MAG: glycosyltransferase [Acidovorax soli]|uniref:glycosyltransferase family 2 protein n=1 Tax=Acidovorax soli TaxID=592050 RepID=UPI0026E9E7E3|nr:glycosyltransferase [Acidovorax soli]MCM2347604.1 glycosyltransferase [Acidovorax soli]
MSVRVSIIIPTFNRSDDIVRLLEDISRQTEKSLEILVVDDGSDEDHVSRYLKLIEARGKRFRFVEKSAAKPLGVLVPPGIAGLQLRKVNTLRFVMTMTDG